MQLFSFTLLVNLFLGVKAVCLQGSVASADGSRCFYFINDARNFASAELICNRRHNGHLAAVNNAFDNAILFNLTQSLTIFAKAYWLGGIKMDPADTNFFWTDGSQVSYMQWAGGQPTASLMCIAHEATTKNWQTRDCGESLPYVCAASSDQTVPTGTPAPQHECHLQGVDKDIFGLQSQSEPLDEETKASKCDDGWTFFVYPYDAQPGYCYKVLKDQPGCMAAFNSCIAVGADVVSIHSEAENAFVLGLSAPASSSKDTPGDDQQTCIGLQRVKEHDSYFNTFQWTDGTPGEYCNWHQGEPSFFENEYCVFMYTSYEDGKPNGMWNDFPCYDKERAVVCKKRANS